MKKDLNTVLDNVKVILSKQMSSSSTTQLKSLEVFNNKEIKPHYLQHIPAEIKYISGYRGTRDTELLEYFVGHGGLKSLWPKISKRYGTDMIELTKASLIAKHSTQLYEASQNRWKPNDTWESTTTLQNIELFRISLQR
jgi:hypothetical protein